MGIGQGARLEAQMERVAMEMRDSATGGLFSSTLGYVYRLLIPTIATGWEGMNDCAGRQRKSLAINVIG